jgi:probable F420-dependent oxidoreductase
MHFGCSVPFSDTADLASFTPRIATAIESRGFESMWLGEHTHLPVETRHPATINGILPERYRRFPEPWVVLSAAAAVTEQLRLGTLIALVAEHNPLVLAKAIATVDQLSRGRVELGVGYGWNKPEMINNGVIPARKRATLHEKLTAMRALWSGDPVSFRGEFVSFSSSWSLPAPAQKGGPRVHLGCAPSERNLADVVSMADGYVPMRAMVEGGDMTGVITRLRRHAELAGRDPDSIEISVAHTGTSWGEANLEKFSRRLPSSADLAAYRELGVTRVICSIPVGPGDLAERALDVWQGRTLQAA